MHIIKTFFLGILLSMCIALTACFLSDYIPLGVVTLSIVLGIIANTFFSFSKNQKFSKGIRFVEKNILSLAIVCMGINLNFFILESLGASLFFLVTSGIFITIISSLCIGKFFNIPYKLSLLLGIGNAICGSSAIASTEKILESKKEDVGVSIAVVNLLGVIGMFFVPFVAIHIFQFTESSAGVLVGNTLQAVGQAVAGGFSVSQVSGEMATLVKMSRVLMLFPLILILLFVVQKNNTLSSHNKNHQNHNGSFPKIPLFIIGFIFFALMASFEVFSENTVLVIKNISKYLLVLAMAAIGLQISFSDMAKSGIKIFGIGLIIFLIQILYSAGVIYILF